MARAQTTVVRNSFVGGLVTEATELTFPENASIEEFNYVLNRNGSRKRRLGMDYESLYTLVDSGKTTLSTATAAVSSFRWDNPDNEAALTMGVVQVGNSLWFLDLGTDAPSSSLLNRGSALSLTSPTIATTISGNAVLQYSLINGVVVVTSAELSHPYYLEYDSTADTVSITKIEIKARDTWGVEDGLATDERPVTLSVLHEYNLYNQGWLTENVRDTSGGLQLPHKHYFGQKAVYPANNAQWQWGQTPDGDDWKFHALDIERLSLGNTPAPRGHFIIDPFTRGSSRTTESGVSTGLQDYDTGSISVSAAFSGRVFYSGVASSIVDGDADSPKLGGAVFFTQLLAGTNNLAKCYQEADPTAEDLNELVATDGGVIIIPEAHSITRLVPRGDSLVVFAENGVWQITGRDGIFSATDYSIIKITDVGCIGAESVVVVEGSVLYWSSAGIYALSADQVTGQLAASNITESTVQSFYDEIPATARVYVKGTYDQTRKKVGWLYNDNSSYDGVNLRYKYNKELVLDVVLNAFYPHSIGELSGDSPFVAAYLPTPEFTTNTTTHSVVVNGVQVQVNGEDVVVTTSTRGNSLSETKYIVLKPQTGGNTLFTLGAYNNTSFLDWEEDDSVGVDAAGYVITGYELGQDIQRTKQVTYFTCFFKRTETGFVLVSGELEAVNPSGCQVSSRWDFANHSNSGKLGTAFEAYRLNRNYLPTGASDPFDYGYSLVETKTKIRGSGTALSLRFDTEPGKDCHILGWGLTMTGGTSA